MRDVTGDVALQASDGLLGTDTRWGLTDRLGSTIGQAQGSKITQLAEYSDWGNGNTSALVGTRTSAELRALASKATMRELQRIPLGKRQRRRLQIVVPHEVVACQARGRYTASLAGALLDPEFEDALQQFANTPGVVGQRARRVLEAARHWKKSNPPRRDGQHSRFTR